jgi:hypothetical protein
MKKILIMIGIVLMNVTLFSCSNDDDQDLEAYRKNVEVFNTGGEDGDVTPPPPTPTPELP